MEKKGKGTAISDNFIYAGLMFKSNLEKRHIYHLYVVPNINARRRVTDLSNNVFEARNF